MSRFTFIARVTDGLPLAEGLESEKNPDLEQYKAQAKNIVKKLSQQSGNRQSRLSVESGNCFLNYLVDNRVCFLALTDKGYPKKLAFQFLEELAKEFGRLYGDQVDSVARPYAFIKFDTFIQKTRKLYLDTQTQRNLLKLNEEMQEVHAIMTKNIQEVLGQGEKLDRMSQISNSLAVESKQYARKAKDIHRQALIRKYGPLAVIVFVIILVFWIRSKFY
uniref:Uncharacterized protein n=1 Tax=Polytomella parva TaxID=51329 RepID=A0A7S0YQF9_9CHLO|mmetsp:Transcript_7910/g.15394  ORF Transcript_7910/g.15394 Transcript_7910/m.15394 type:complete len:219 (+) Transcript_7910:167-823(+)|eukprot:CAMPEP_0175064638 /NCGR_PEP_ID=MMETSP0052_2-20121109/15452_1 /TAXON_ID=51329 ORGANISM="Polytomella parva, Strain SAG 63-3" /NCGR_SAMPLE_ID=MMETSP0052_2 /ASSEMBLY_ACC=CAM_ASM_000194 /LENGTH=218 /DNA_ID=CAMNT_0016331027 /DNA_START=90 /DNA_END=746 /DNA_ORIENTATION=+